MAAAFIDDFGTLDRAASKLYSILDLDGSKASGKMHENAR